MHVGVTAVCGGVAVMGKKKPMRGRGQAESALRELYTSCHRLVLLQGTL